MATQMALKRLTKEYKDLENCPVPYIEAHPSESNILNWHFILTGPPDTPYAGGSYYGMLLFYANYPFEPPGIKVITPSGRFEPNRKICLSISDFHRETWNPSFSVGTILNGLLSFMTGDESTTGSIKSTSKEKILHAKLSHKFNKEHNGFNKEFPDYYHSTFNATKKGENLKVIVKLPQRKGVNFKQEPKPTEIPKGPKEVKVSILAVETNGIKDYKGENSKAHKNETAVVSQSLKTIKTTAVRPTENKTVKRKPSLDSSKSKLSRKLKKFFHKGNKFDENSKDLPPAQKIVDLSVEEKFEVINLDSQPDEDDENVETHNFVDGENDMGSDVEFIGEVEKNQKHEEVIFIED
ncbi:hypothetical protein WICMUC_003580 [Wickerhamomyces mucosus]|uniref:UBC core domain-containing protein n=1 Tax=Wickerhamomyces mucosus TaxID=1378264 RepID=A0A9P8PLM8_9ASCO|nr:hypothetical protein WICMUC_003580 [Wickerhamomyces mucosus]